MNSIQDVNRTHVIASYTVATLALLFVLGFGLVPALLAALLVHELVHLLAARLPARWVLGKRPKVAIVALLAVFIVTAIVGAVLGLIAFFHSDAGSLSRLLSKLAEIIDRSRSSLPSSVQELLPVDPEQLRTTIVNWLREHAAEVQHLGKEAFHVVAQIIIGIIIGGMAAVREAQNDHARGPLTKVLVHRVNCLATSFRQVVFAQAKISAINAAATAFYLALVLPALGIHLPLVKTMIALTFLFGLVPVVGNLLSNIVIVVVSLGHSLATAGGSLLFLVLIHKAEYFLNAKIVGNAIKSHAIELIVAMVAFEAAFGLAGVIVAPILYAYLKAELDAARLI